MEKLFKIIGTLFVIMIVGIVLYVAYCAVMIAVGLFALCILVCVLGLILKLLAIPFKRKQEAKKFIKSVELAYDYLNEVEAILDSYSIIDTNIWMDENFEIFFKIMTCIAQSTRRTIPICDLQIFELVQIICNQESSAKKRKSATNAISKLLELGQENLLRIVVVNKIADVDRSLVNGLKHAAHDGRRCILISNDFELKVRARNALKECCSNWDVINKPGEYLESCEFLYNYSNGIITGENANFTKYKRLKDGMFARMSMKSRLMPTKDDFDYEKACVAVEFINDIERALDMCIIIETAIWMDSKYEPFFNLLRCISIATGKPITISSLQFDEFGFIKKNRQFGTEEAGAARKVIQFLNTMQCKGCFEFINMNPISKRQYESCINGYVLDYVKSNPIYTLIANVTPVSDNVHYTSIVDNNIHHKLSEDESLQNLAKYILATLYSNHKCAVITTDKELRTLARHIIKDSASIVFDDPESLLCKCISLDEISKDMFFINSTASGMYVRLKNILIDRTNGINLAIDPDVTPSQA